MDMVCTLENNLTLLFLTACHFSLLFLCCCKIQDADSLAPTALGVAAAAGVGFVVLSEVKSHPVKGFNVLLVGNYFELNI